MILVVADSLRYDFAKEYLFDVFKTESFTKVIARGTWTPPTFVTILTGLTPDKHGVRIWWDKANYNRCLFDYFRSWETISYLLAEGPFNKPDALLQTESKGLKIFHPLPFNAVSNNEHEVFASIHRNPDLVLYHSYYTHFPYGIANFHCGGYFTQGSYQQDLHNKTHEEIKNMYRWGVLELKDRLRQIEEITDGRELIIVTADHGELLKDRGSSWITHGANRPHWSEILEVPFFINREWDFKDVYNQEEVLDLILKIGSKYDKEALKCYP